MSLWGDDEPAAQRSPLLLGAKYGPNDSGPSGDYEEEDTSGPLKADAAFSGVRPHTHRPWRDVPVLVVFLVAVLAAAGTVGYAYKHGNPELLDRVRAHDGTALSGFEDAVRELRRDKGVVLGGLMGGLALALLWTQALKWATRAFVYATVIGGTVAVLVLGVWALVLGVRRDSTGLKAVGGLAVVGAVVLAVLFVWLREKIDLTAKLMTHATKGLESNPSLVPISLLVGVLMAGVVGVWAFGLTYLYSIPADGGEDGDGRAVKFATTPRHMIYFLMFMLFWLSAYLMAVFQTTVAGAMSHWYFSKHRPDYVESTSSPALQTLGRSLTKSAGSLSLGALIVAIVEFVMWLFQKAQRAQRANKLLACLFACARCLLGCVLGLIQFINKFAYVYIAMHGHGFFRAARDCFRLLRRNGFNAVVVDLITDFVLLAGRVLGTALLMTITVAILNANGHELSAVSLSTIAVGTFAIFSLFSVILSTGVDAMLVCYFEDSERSGCDKAQHMDEDIDRELQSCKQRNHELLDMNPDGDGSVQV